MPEAITRLSAFAQGYARARWGGRFADRRALERWQDRAAQRHLRWVLRNSPFYAELYAGRDLASWRTFPTIDKAAMMRAFSTLNTAGITREEAESVALAAERSRDFGSTIGDVTVGLSSGTSGSRGLFLVRPQERHRWAGALLAKIVPELLGRKRHRMALFLRADSRLYQTLGGRRFRFAFFDLMRPLDELAAELEAYAPTIVAAPPSVLRALATRIEHRTLEVRPERVISVAEVLDPIDRPRIERAFGRRVDQVYQCTEGFLGATCAHGTLHINEDLVVVQPEWIDGDRFTPIVTDLSRTTQPIVRYRLNDVLVARHDRCPCGSTFRALERIEGRSDDVLLGVGADGAAIPVFADLLTRQVISASDAIEEYTIVQRADGSIEVGLLMPTPSLREGERRETESRVASGVRGVFERLGATPPEVRFTAELPLPGTTKLRRVRREPSSRTVASSPERP